MTLAAADAPVVSRTRWRLMAWSGGLTLVILVLLGAGMYVAVARALEADAIAQLERRAAPLAHIIEVGTGQMSRGGQFRVAVPPGMVAAGISFLGPSAGTAAILVTPDDQVIGLGAQTGDFDLPYRPGLAAARSGGRAIDTAELAGSQVRVLSESVDAADGQVFVVQVIADRGLEDRTLGAILWVLVIGGWLVMAAALGLGYLYAGRALVPLRESLQRQREFAADVSHELRTPLSVVRATVADLERRPDDRIAEAAGDLREIETQAERLTEQIDELLLYARAESGAIELASEIVDLSEAAVAATRRMTRTAERAGVRIEAELAPVEVSGDARRLEQLTAILVDNAVRHSNRGGVVSVAVSRTGAGAELAVADRGPGIASGELERIFDRFHRAPEGHPGGVGLGLAIARWIADRHDGAIHAENRPDGGARFVVRLPPAR